MYRDIAGFEGDTVYSFTSSLDSDKEIMDYAVHVVLAHTLHLFEQGIISRETLCSLGEYLIKLAENPQVVFEGGNYEDVWEAIEAWLTSKAGEAAGEIWIGRSRNDHVSAALRLKVLWDIYEIMTKLIIAREAIIEKAESSKDIIILLHTHSQPSQLAPVQCLLASWEEALKNIFELYKTPILLVDKSPLGASAGAGSLAPLNPGSLGAKLGFPESIDNPVYATGSRLDLTSVAQVTGLLLMELSRIAEDIIFMSNPYVGVLVLPDNHIATSSVMPHKRNPVTLEVLRARVKIGFSKLYSIMDIQARLQSGYSLDLQEINRELYSLFTIAKDSLYIITDLIKGMEWDNERLEYLKEKYVAYGAELAEAIALKEGKPFREAYHRVIDGIHKNALPDLLSKYGYNSPSELVYERKTGCKAGDYIVKEKSRLGDDSNYVGKLRERLETYPHLLVKELKQSLNGCNSGN